MNLAHMFKQAQQVKQRLEDAQKDLAAAEVVAEVGNGSVSVVCDGQGKFKSIKLTKEALNPDSPASVDEETVEMLQDLITKAMNQAMADASKKMQDKMKGIIPPGLNIPGLF